MCAMFTFAKAECAAHHASCSSGAGATFVDFGGFSGIGQTLNDPPTLATLAAADASSTATGLVEIGLLKLVVASSGVVLISGAVVDMAFVYPNGDASRVLDQPFVAGSGYAAISKSRRKLLQVSDFTQVGLKGQLLAPRHRRQMPALLSHRKTAQCDPCDSASGDFVPGDFSGDCQFSVDDVSYQHDTGLLFTDRRQETTVGRTVQQKHVLQLQLFQAARADFVDGLVAIDPFDHLCPWKQAQANPNYDILSGFGDARDGKANCDSADALWLLNALLQKYRFVKDVKATCDGFGVHVTIDVVGGSNQRKAEILADSQNTEVLLEVRLEAATNYSLFDFAAGARIVDRIGAPPGNSLLIQTEPSFGGVSPFVMSFQPIGGWRNDVSIKLAVLIETKDADGVKEAPRRYAALRGSSLWPYTDYGSRFSSFREVGCSRISPAYPPPRLAGAQLPPSIPAPAQLPNAPGPSAPANGQSPSGPNTDFSPPALRKPEFPPSLPVAWLAPQPVEPQLPPSVPLTRQVPSAPRPSAPAMERPPSAPDSGLSPATSVKAAVPPSLPMVSPPFPIISQPPIAVVVSPPVVIPVPLLPASSPAAPAPASVTLPGSPVLTVFLSESTATLRIEPPMQRETLSFYQLVLREEGVSLAAVQQLLYREQEPFETWEVTGLACSSSHVLSVASCTASGECSVPAKTAFTMPTCDGPYLPESPSPPKADTSPPSQPSETTCQLSVQEPMNLRHAQNALQRGSITDQVEPILRRFLQEANCGNCTLAGVEVALTVAARFAVSEFASRANLYLNHSEQLQRPLLSFERFQKEAERARSLSTLALREVFCNISSQEMECKVEILSAVINLGTHAGNQLRRKLSEVTQEIPRVIEQGGDVGIKAAEPSRRRRLDHLGVAGMTRFPIKLPFAF
eukprot:6205749-Pleurochrysis_carterae.AAC.2